MARLTVVIRIKTKIRGVYTGQWHSSQKFAAIMHTTNICPALTTPTHTENYFSYKQHAWSWTVKFECDEPESVQIVLQLILSSQVWFLKLCAWVNSHVNRCSKWLMVRWGPSLFYFKTSVLMTALWLSGLTYPYHNLVSKLDKENLDTNLKNSKIQSCVDLLKAQWHFGLENASWHFHPFYFIFQWTNWLMPCDFTQ